MSTTPDVKMCRDLIRMPGFFSENAFYAGIKYKAQPGQIYVSTFPKCGTTWTQHIVLLILRKGEAFDTKYFFSHSPFLEMGGPEMVDAMTEPGVIKTHLPYALTPMHPEAKYIYVARNPKDTSVSLFHHNRNFPGYNFKNGQFDEFFEYFMRGDTEWDDYFDHIMGWYKHRDDSNLFFITYEELKKDPGNSIKRLAQFLGEEHGKAMEDPELLKKVVYHSSVEYMKKHAEKGVNDFFSLPPEVLASDPNISEGLRAALQGLAIKPEDEERTFNFVRKGVVGDWKTLYSSDQSKRMDLRCIQKLGGTDLETIFRDNGCFDTI